MKQVKVIGGIARHFNMNLVKSEWLIFHISFTGNGVIKI
jgi:hypothetical protein